MDMLVIYLIFIFIFCAIVIYFGIQKKKKQTELYKYTDFNKEFLLADKYKEEFLGKQLAFIQKQMEEYPIDAINYAINPYGYKDDFKDGVKNTLKSMATLATVKYQTVQTPKYLILSNETLHLLNTDTDGDIIEHFKFGPERLKQSTIEEVESKQSANIYADLDTKNDKVYKILLATDNKPIELIIFSRLLSPNTTNEALGALAFIDYFYSDNKKIIKEVIIANQFLKKLGELYPNLKVELTIS